MRCKDLLLLVAFVVLALLGNNLHGVGHDDPFCVVIAVLALEGFYGDGTLDIYECAYLQESHGVLRDVLLPDLHT